MKNKEKQIEQIFNDIVEITDRPYYYDNKGHAHIDFADLDKLAEKLSEKYQPKLSEDSVMLSREEYQKDFSDQFNNGYKHGSKETAEKIILSEIQIIKCLRDICVLPDSKYREGYIDCCDTILFFLKNNPAKQFGVEIKE